MGKLTKRFVEAAPANPHLSRWQTDVTWFGDRRWSGYGDIGTDERHYRRAWRRGEGSAMCPL